MTGPDPAGGGGGEDLAERRCVPCRGGVPPLSGDRVAALAARIPDWEVVQNHHLRREFRFSDFAGALAFVNRAGAVAERENHHPDLELSWGRVAVSIHTHAVDGLTESDFILAAKIERVAS